MRAVPGVPQAVPEPWVLGVTAAPHGFLGAVCGGSFVGPELVGRG